MAKWIALGALAALVLLFIFALVVAWTLVGLVVLLILFVLFVPIGADVSYLDRQFRLAARIDGFAIQLFPRKKKKEEKPPEEEKPKEEKPKEEKPKEEKPKKEFNFTKDELLDIVKKAIKGLGKFGKLTVRKFVFHYTAGGDDPYNTAMEFNFMNSALSALAPLCAKTFRVGKALSVWTNVDFEAESTQLDAELSITLRLIQVVRAAVAAGIGVVGVLIRRHKRLKKEAKLAAQTGAEEPGTEEQTPVTDQANIQPEQTPVTDQANAQPEQTPIIDQANMQPEERKDSNG